METIRTFEKIAEFIFNNHKLTVFGELNAPLFSATEIAKMIDYSAGVTSKMVEIVSAKNKILTDDISYITSEGLYEILMVSSKPIAQEFKLFVQSIIKGFGNVETQFRKISERILKLKESGDFAVNVHQIAKDPIENMLTQNELNKLVDARIFKHNKKVLIIAGAVIIIAAGSYIGYKIYKKKKTKQK